MKKFFGRLFEGLIAIFLVPIFGVVLAIVLPFDYIKYKRSYFYQQERKKYTLFAGSSQNFELYNEIIKNNLPIQFVCHPDGLGLEYGWFVFNKTLIIPSVFSFQYNTNDGNWYYCIEDEEEKRVLITLDEYIETEIQEINSQLKENICNDAVVLIDSCCCAEDEDAFENEPKFVLYDDNLSEVLLNFCNPIKNS